MALDPARQLLRCLLSCHDNKAFDSFIPDNTSGLWNSQNRPGVKFWRYCCISSRRTAKGNKSGMSPPPVCPRCHKVRLLIPKINCRHCRIKHRRAPTFIKRWGKFDLIWSQTCRTKRRLQFESQSVRYFQTTGTSGFNVAIPIKFTQRLTKDGLWSAFLEVQFYNLRALDGNFWPRIRAVKNRSGTTCNMYTHI